MIAESAENVPNRTFHEGCQDVVRNRKLSSVLSSIVKDVSVDCGQPCDHQLPKKRKTDHAGTSSRQERLADTIMSEGLEKLSQKPQSKQAEVKQGTPEEVARELAIEAGQSLTKKEYDEFGGLVRNSDATKLQVCPFAWLPLHQPVGAVWLLTASA